MIQNGEEERAGLTIINNFGFLSAKKFQYSGLVLTNSTGNEGEVWINGRTQQTCYPQPGQCNQQVCDCNGGQNTYFEETLQKCLYKKTEDNEKVKLHMLCGRNGTKPDNRMPERFDPKIAQVNLIVEYEKAEHVEEKYHGSYLGVATDEFGHQYNEKDMILHISNHYMFILNQERKSNRGYQAFQCTPKFQDGDKLDCIDFFEPNMNDMINRSMLFTYDQNTKELAIAYSAKGNRPQNFVVSNETGIFKASKLSDTAITYATNKVSEWVGENKDVFSGVIRKQKLFIDENRVTMINKYSLFEGVYTVSNKQDNGGILSSLGMSASRSTDKVPFTRFALERTVMRYKVENNQFIISQDIQNRGVAPAKIDFNDPQQFVQVFRLPNAKSTKLRIQNIIPSEGGAGTRIRLKVLIDTGSRRAFKACPTTINVFIGKAACLNVECDEENFVIRCTLPQTTEYGPLPISYEMDGIHVKTSHIVQVYPTNPTELKGTIKAIYPAVGSTKGNFPVFIPFSSPDSPTAADMNVTIGDRPCTQLKVVAKVLECVAPSLPSPGEYLVKVHPKDGYVLSNIYFTAKNPEDKLRLSNLSPNQGPQAGNTLVKFIIFVKGADGNVPEDLAVSINFGDQEAPFVSQVKATSNNEIYTVEARTPKFSELGHTKVKFTAVTRGEVFVGFSTYHVVSSNRNENVRIASVSPTLLNETGGILTIKAFVPRTYVDVDKKERSIFSLFSTEGDVPLGIHLGPHACLPLSKPTLKCPEDATKPCLGGVVCQAPPAPFGSYKVVLSFPGGSSVGTIWVTYQSPVAPKITSVTPAASEIIKPANLTIKGSHFSKSARSILSASTECDASIQVSLGGEPCKNLVCPANNEIKAECNPPITSGSSALVVSTSEGSTPEDTSVNGAASISVTSTNQPTITSVSPATGGVSGGTKVTIDGSKFGSDSSVVSVFVGGTPCTGVVLDSTSKLSCYTSGGVSGSASITVSVDSEQSSAYTSFAYEGEPVCDNCKDVDLNIPDDNNDDEKSSASTVTFSMAILCVTTLLSFIL